MNFPDTPPDASNTGYLLAVPPYRFSLCLGNAREITESSAPPHLDSTALPLSDLAPISEDLLYCEVPLMTFELPNVTS